MTWSATNEPHRNDATNGRQSVVLHNDGAHMAFVGCRQLGSAIYLPRLLPAPQIYEAHVAGPASPGIDTVPRVKVDQRDRQGCRCC